MERKEGWSTKSNLGGMLDKKFSKIYLRTKYLECQIFRKSDDFQKIILKSSKTSEVHVKKKMTWWFSMMPRREERCGPSMIYVSHILIVRREVTRNLIRGRMGICCGWTAKGRDIIVCRTWSSDSWWKPQISGVSVETAVFLVLEIISRVLFIFNLWKF